MSICHLIPNDRKFFDHVASVMEAVNPGRNTYVVAPGLAVLKLEGESIGNRAKICETIEEFQEVAVRSVASAEGVIAHSLERYMGEPLLAASPETPVLWAVWGGDLAEAMPVYRYATLLTHTAAVKLSLAVSGKLRRRQPGQAIRFAAGIASRTFDPDWWPGIARAFGRTKASADFSKAASRIDLYASLEPMPGLAEAMPGFGAKWLPEFKYYLIEAPDQTVAGPDILIGNRATPSCNHLDAFREVRRAGITEGRIVLPLNYGSDRYADVVEAEARRLFGDRVFAIRDWMPYEDYTKIVARCGTVLMNFRRGQALGTTAMSLAQGARVFLRKDNLHYRYYTRLGLKIFAVDDPKDHALLGRALSPEDQERNRRIITQVFGREAVQSRAAELLDEMHALRAQRLRAASRSEKAVHGAA